MTPPVLTFIITIRFTRTAKEIFQTSNSASGDVAMAVDDQALMGMGVESVEADEKGFDVLTPGARVSLDSSGELVVEQRIGARREILRSHLPAHLSPWVLRGRTPFRCLLSGVGMDLTIQGDSVLIFSPQQNFKLAFEGLFEARYSAEHRGNRLLLDEDGGCGFFAIPQRPSAIDDSTNPWRLGFHMARWDELWVSVCPPRERNAKRYSQSIAHEGSIQHPYPSDELIRDASQHCQILAIHEAWAKDAPPWAQNPPGSDYRHPKPWETDQHVPADMEEFLRVQRTAHDLGMSLVVYLSPLYSNAPNLLAEMKRVLDEYDVDGLYFDGWSGVREDFRRHYRLIREARALLGERLLYLHSSTEPFGTSRVYLPFVYAYADFVLSGEAGRFDLETEDFLRYNVGQYQISNSVGMWCHYGSWSDQPGYHQVVPSTENIEMALRNHVRLWRQSQAWSEFPAELQRFDREYYGSLAKLSEDSPLG